MWYKWQLIWNILDGNGNDNDTISAILTEQHGYLGLLYSRLLKDIQALRLMGFQGHHGQADNTYCYTKKRITLTVIYVFQELCSIFTTTIRDVTITITAILFIFYFFFVPRIELGDALPLSNIPRSFYYLRQGLAKLLWLALNLAILLSQPPT